MFIAGLPLASGGGGTKSELRRRAPSPAAFCCPQYVTGRRERILRMLELPGRFIGRVPLRSPSRHAGPSFARPYGLAAAASSNTFVFPDPTKPTRSRLVPIGGTGMAVAFPLG